MATMAVMCRVGVVFALIYICRVAVSGTLYNSGDKVKLFYIQTIVHLYGDLFFISTAFKSIEFVFFVCCTYLDQ